MAELQQAPALTPVQLGKMPSLGDVAEDEPDQATLVQPMQPLPLTLPECTISDRTIRQHFHYSLPQYLQHMDPLYSQVTLFSSWCTTPLQLDRQSRAICQRSLGNVMADVLLFLGFLHYFMTDAERGHAVLSLSLARDAELLAAFMSFMQHKGSALSTLTQTISHLRKVLEWLAVTAVDLQQGRRVEQVADWLSRLSRQLSQTMPKKRKDPVDLQEMGQWMDASDVVQLHERIRTTALSFCPLAPRLCSPWQAQQLHDACLVNLSMGYLPPVRPTCLISIQVPDPESRCMKQDCKLRDCKGNRLELKDGRLSLVLPHHKVQEKGSAAKIQLQLPQELNDLISTFLAQGHLVISNNSRFLFTRNGQQVTQSGLTYHFKKIYRATNAPASIYPQLLRHIFVSERESLDRAVGPENAGAALIMGNSEAQWRRSYDLSHTRRETQQAVADMASWRRAMLGKPATDDSDSDIDIMH